MSASTSTRRFESVVDGNNRPVMRRVYEWTMPHVVISQIYAAGGNSGATYKNDFVELYNRSDAAVNLTGWSIQYASATGTNWSATNLSGSIAAGGYYLVQLHGGMNGIDLPTADATGNSNLAITAGKIALVSSQNDLSGACPKSTDILDLIGYGSAASCFQGDAAASAPGTATNALMRNDNGCQSRRQNSSDFFATTVSPRNGASTAQTCNRWVLTENIALFYDDWNLVAEVDAGTNTVIAKYVHGARIDELISKTAGNSTVYYLADHLGSIRALTNENGAIVESYRYVAFGKPAIYNASGVAIATSAHGNRFMFTGREFIPEIEIYDYRNRNYSSELGRFLQNDPIRFEAGDVNLYRYASNNPVILVDSEGLIPIPVVIVVVGGVIIIIEEWKFGMDHASDVSERAKEKWPGDPQQNAMRHCIWQCESTQERGETYAEVAGWMHELSAPPDLDQLADLVNNQCGRDLGTDSQAQCEEECENLWETGDLMSNQ